ncbi:TPA: hypothetical protein U5D84_002590 [Yersinia enterocolitica]|nr:hypothetical protein [Yersinia enterocolitica]
MTIADYKALLEIIKSTDSSIWVALLLFLLIPTFSVLLIFVKGYSVKYSEIQAITNNFITLKKQLVENTEIVKSIESRFTHKLWINQQVWLKKQEIYEDIFLCLYHIKNYISENVKTIDKAYYFSSFRDPGFPEDYLTKSALKQMEDAWKEEKAIYDKRPDIEEEIENFNILKINHLKSLKIVLEKMQVKSIFIDKDVFKELSIILNRLNQEKEESSLEYYEYIEEDTDRAIDRIKGICAKELQLLNDD